MSAGQNVTNSLAPRRYSVTRVRLWMEVEPFILSAMRSLLQSFALNMSSSMMQRTTSSLYVESTTLPSSSRRASTSSLLM